MSNEEILIVKGILAKNTIIAGTHGYEYDTICYILREDIFKAILGGSLYIKDTYFIYKALSINKLWNEIEIKKNNILDALWNNPYIRDDPYFNKYIYWIENAMITKLLLQHLENKLYRYHQIRKAILDYEPLAFSTLYIYNEKYRKGSLTNINPKTKEEKIDIETILRMYKAIRKHDLKKIININEIFKEILMAILNKDYVDIKSELEMIKAYTIINKKAKLRKKIKQLKDDIKRINKQIAFLKVADPSNPKIKELENEKEKIEKELAKLKKNWHNLKRNIQNKDEKAKMGSKEIESKNGQ